MVNNWNLYDLSTGEMIRNKTKILDYIACPPEETRVIPDFFEKVYEINAEIVRDIEKTYKEVEQQEAVAHTRRINSDRSKKFVSSIIRNKALTVEDELKWSLLILSRNH